MSEQLQKLYRIAERGGWFISENKSEIRTKIGDYNLLVIITKDVVNFVTFCDGDTDSITVDAVTSDDIFLMLNQSYIKPFFE